MAKGFRVERIGNANRFTYVSSFVLVPDGTVASQTLGREVATTLRLPATAVRINTQQNDVADVIVIVGRDYRP